MTALSALQSQNASEENHINRPMTGIALLALAAASK